MTPQKSTQPTTESPKNCNIAEAQEKYHKIVYINMIEDLKEEIDKAIKEIYENSYTHRKKLWKEMNIKFQDLKVKTESIN